jgi:hypothetical protein
MKSVQGEMHQRELVVGVNWSDGDGTERAATFYKFYFMLSRLRIEIGVKLSCSGK